MSTPKNNPCSLEFLKHERKRIDQMEAEIDVICKHPRLFIRNYAAFNDWERWEALRLYIHPLVQQYEFAKKVQEQMEIDWHQEKLQLQDQLDTEARAKRQFMLNNYVETKVGETGEQLELFNL